MISDTKEKLLLRLFSSIEYMEGFTDHYVKGLQAAIDAFSVFEQKYLSDPHLYNRYDMEFRQWKNRVIPNFQGMKESAPLSLEKAKEGDFAYIEGTTGNLRGLSKDMDGIGWDWWDEVDPHYSKVLAENLSKARKMGNNIYYTLSGFWNPGEILREGITGPIDEQQLLKYLQPGEKI